MSAAFTAAMFLAALSQEVRTQYEQDPERIAIIAIAAERAQSEMTTKWRHLPNELSGAIVAGIITESGARADIHDGTRRGLDGDICIMQIHRGNGNWKKFVTAFDQLAGHSVASTKLCILTGITTLSRGLNYCLNRNYKTNWGQAMWTMYRFGHKCWLADDAYKRTGLMNKIAWTKWEPTDEHRALIKAALERATEPRGSVQQ